VATNGNGRRPEMEKQASKRYYDIPHFLKENKTNVQIQIHTVSCMLISSVYLEP